MKKIKRMPLLFAAVCGLLFAFSACGENKGENKGENLVPSERSALVAYFSATGNTKKIAEYVAEITEGTLYEITPQIPYTQADLNYSDRTTRATAEQNDPDARPAISGSVGNMAEYDVVYLGYPIWWGKAPKIIYTFLESYSFSGKTIVPFCTSGSSGIGGSATDLHSLTSGATWLGGGSFYASTARSAVETWISGLEF